MASDSREGRYDSERVCAHGHRACAGPTPIIIRARLVKLASADGLVEFEDGTPIGKIYIIDLATKERQRMKNIKHGAVHEKDVVREYCLDGSLGGWLPLECLELLT